MIISRNQVFSFALMVSTIFLPRPVPAEDDIKLTENNFPVRKNYFPDNHHSQPNKADDLLMNAMAMLGVNYKWGSSSPDNGLDCSGFIQYIFKNSTDVNLPRTSRMMAQEGVFVRRYELKSGDLIFFATRKRSRHVSHVGVYIGDNKFIHAPRTGKSIEISDLNSQYWSAAYLEARRIAE